MCKRWWILMLACAGAQSVGAQQLRVQVLDSLSREPLAGAVLTISRANGLALAEALADAQGRHVFALPAATVRVRVRRIGFRPFLSDTLVVASGERLVTLLVPADRVILPTIRATAQRTTCDQAVPDSIRSAAFLLWDAIRTSLAASLISRRDSLVVERVTRYADTLGLDGKLLGRSRLDFGVTDGRPFSAVSPSVLESQGYFAHGDGEDVYHGLDEVVLLSAEFENDHCFGLTSDERAQPGNIRAARAGLTFVPRPDRHLPDVRGTLWVDSASLELRSLEFTYVHVDAHTRAQATGLVDFRHLPQGLWVVADWKLRLPRTAMWMSGGSPSYSLIGYLETGGVATVVSRDSTVRPLHEP